VSEFERLKAPPGLDARSFEMRLLDATRHVPFEVFRRTRTGFTAAGEVGLVEAGGLSVELLPKAGILEPDPDGSFSAGLLLNLLSYAGITSRAVPLGGRVERTHRPLLESVARGFATSLVQHLTDGVPRRYRERLERTTVLRGRLEMRELARRPVLTDGRLPVRYAPLQPDHELSRAIASTARLIAQITRSSRTWSILQFCLAHLEDVHPAPLTPELVARVQLTSAEEHWRPVLDMARLLATGWRPLPVKAGATRTLSLVFPVNDLFELVLRKAIPRAIASYGLILGARRLGGHLLRSVATNRYAISLRPDYVFRHSGSAAVAIVGDAKWKVLEPTKSLGLQEDDVYQLVTYMTRHRLKRGLLFFPLRPWMIEKNRKEWWHTFEIAEAPEVHLSLVGVDVGGLVSREAKTRRSAELSLGTAIASATR